MDPAYVSAAFGLAGATLGGATSFLTSWSTQRVQLRSAHQARVRANREALFRDFVLEASRLYGDALSHEKDEVADLVQLYALVGHIRLVATRKTVSSAEEAMDRIAATYLEPNRTLHEMRTLAHQGGMNVLADFSDAARLELTAEF